MKKIIKYIAFLGLALLPFIFYGCSEDTLEEKLPEKGTPLNLYVKSSGAVTRLEELGSIDDINTLTDDKQHIGLYIYYQDDYDQDNLTKPYIRNLECQIDDKGRLVPVNGQSIYIYDRMKIVAFYPYNAHVSDFIKRADESEYPVSESDYEQQTYIPYRGETTVNPTNAFLVSLNLAPLQTFKVQLVLVADQPADFPQSQDKQNGEIKLFPTIDPHTTGYTAGEDRREFWVDRIDNFSPGTGGKYVRRYNAYIWKTPEADKHHDAYKHQNNKIEKGELLFQSDELTLMVSEAIDFSQRSVYRYGYNMNTGEIFVPTSESLVYDAETLQNAGSAYQVCDIDLNGFNWTPKKYYSGNYDGGGHAIKGLKIDEAPTVNNPDGSGVQGFGLFGSIVGNSTLKNINLVSPEITVDFTNSALTDTCSIGALCGVVNPKLPAGELYNAISATVPEGLPDVVRDALIQEQMMNFVNTTSTIRGCKVENPSIEANGEKVIAGGLCGVVGSTDQKGSIQDSYVSQTSTAAGIAVNAATEEMKITYEQGNIGSFCGLLASGSITNSYTSLSTVYGYHKWVNTATTPVTIASTEASTGFCDIAAGLPSGVTASVNGCYASKQEDIAGVTNFADGWPAWPLFNGGNLTTADGWPAWPVQQSLGDYEFWGSMGSQASVFPTLIWESAFYLENK